MKERPILFSGAMVRAILSGTKTQTRRTVRLADPERPGAELLYPIPPHAQMLTSGDAEFCFDGAFERVYRARSRYGVPGDRLWVRESWYDDNALRDPAKIVRRADGGVVEVEYRASHDCKTWEVGCPCRSDYDRSLWRPSIHMPRWASRLTLEVTNVRVERLQSMSLDDVFEELGETKAHAAAHHGESWEPFDAFADLWDSLNGKRAWDSNPWVWVVGFQKVGAK